MTTRFQSSNLTLSQGGTRCALSLNGVMEYFLRFVFIVW